MEWDDDDEFTREPLDAAKIALHGDGHSDESSLVDEPLPGDEFTREPLDPMRSAGNRAKRPTRRVLLSIGGCALLAIVLLTSTGTAANLWRQARFAWLTHTAPTLTRTTMTPQPPGKRTLPGGWRRLPTFSTPDPNLPWAMPASNDPNTWYSCSASQTDAKGNQEDGPLTFWYSHDAGQHWASVRVPGATATSCSLIAAPDDPRRMSLVSQRTGQLSTQAIGCGGFTAYLSDDGGAHWQLVPSLPGAPIQSDRFNFCGLTLSPARHHLYLYYDYAICSGPPGCNTQTGGGSLERSDDGGQTWKRLNQNQPPGDEGGYPLLLDDGETLLLTDIQFEPAARGNPEQGTTWLWVSRDAGDNWEPLAAVDGLFVQTVLPLAGARALTPSTAHPLYLISEASISSRLLRIQIAQATDMRHYAPLPPLPVAGATPEHMGITTVLTTTPAGKLLVFGLGPDDHIPTDSVLQADDPQFARQWLWEWDPQAHRWTLLAPALDAPWPQCGDHCWPAILTPAQGAGATGMYLTVWHGVENGQIALFGISLPGLE
ncbi:MAG TPA: sialidase family protein [Ktedonobacterales bacterium]|jgi:hypothetical protein